MKAKENKFLTLGKNVVLNDLTEKVIVGLEKYFAEANLKAVVTSVVRTPEDQLRIIRDYLKNQKLDAKYPEAMTCGLKDIVVIDGVKRYAWQMGWSALLNKRVIINPPLKATLLMDYIGATGKNRKGDVFNQTAHASGLCVDIGGGFDHSIKNELAVVKKALSDKLPGLFSIVPEHNNNCVHLNCKAV